MRRSRCCVAVPAVHLTHGGLVVELQAQGPTRSCRAIQPPSRTSDWHLERGCAHRPTVHVSGDGGAIIREGVAPRRRSADRALRRDLLPGAERTLGHSGRFVAASRFDALVRGPARDVIAAGVARRPAVLGKALPSGCGRLARVRIHVATACREARGPLGKSLPGAADENSEGLAKGSRPQSICARTDMGSGLGCPHGGFRLQVGDIPSKAPA